MAKDTRELTAEELADVTGGHGILAESAQYVAGAYKRGYTESQNAREPAWISVQRGKAEAWDAILDIEAQAWAAYSPGTGAPNTNNAGAAQNPADLNGNGTVENAEQVAYDKFTTAVNDAYGKLRQDYMTAEQTQQPQ